MKCIIDFCGYYEPGHFPTSFSADWDGEKVFFSGEWSVIPPLMVSIEPTETEIYDYVNTFKDV